MGAACWTSTDPKRVKLTRASVAARPLSPALAQRAPVDSASGSFVSAVKPLSDDAAGLSLQRQEHLTSRSVQNKQGKHGRLSSSMRQKVKCKVQLWYQGVRFVHLELPGSADVSALKQQLRYYTFGDKRVSSPVSATALRCQTDTA